ncbi:MAG: glycoside hydrolase family 43 protein [Planctomycetota bacterium]
MPLSIACLVVALLCLLQAAAPPAEEATYTNPIGDLRMGDPFVARFGDRYVLTGTTHANRGFAAWTSEDLLDWTPAGMLLEREEDGWADGAYWAPELFAYRDRYWLAYSARSVRAEGTPRFRLALAVADAPTGPYTDVATPWFDDGRAAIDAHVFIDGDTPYLFFARVGQRDDDGKLVGTIWGVELAADLSGPVGEPVQCVVPEQPWELPADGTSICNEGPFVFREGERYFMLFSAGHWAEPNYAIGYAVAEHPLGPWTKPENNPLMGTGMTPGVSGPGHCSLTVGPAGDRIVVYHAHENPDQPRGPRTVNLDRLHVRPDGTLDIAGPTRTPQPKP